MAGKGSRKGNARQKRYRRKQKGRRTYKDSLFCDIFSDKENALSLFNALNGTDYTDAENLEVLTLKDVVYMTMHNDVAFAFHGTMNLWEHQSTKSDNMPLRAFLYSASEYDKWLIRHRADILGSKQVKVPAPKCFEMYNGESEMPDLSEKRLSDAFMQPSPGYEWTVYVLNINEGRNLELMARCMPLRAYSKFVQMVRDGMAKGQTLEEALQEALDYCIEHGLLSSYFAVNKGRLVRMMLTKYATKFHEEALREEGREEGR